MPAETHQHGGTAGADEVVELLCVLIADGAVDDPAVATLAGLGVDEQSLGDLWEAVCEELAERTLAPELEPGTLRPSMTLAETAAVMVSLLAADADPPS